jgi:Alginate export
MTTKVRALTTIALGAALISASAQTTQTATQAAAGAPPPPPLSSTEQTIYDIKNPVPWLNWGADLRVRDEYFNDLLTLNPNARLHEQNYIRFRARLWTTVTPVENLSLNARISDEAREWTKPAGYTPMKGQSGLDMREGIVDNLNAEMKNVAGLPLTIKAGRQDLFLGDGWLVGDGTPYDGSWTYYLDSAKVTYELKDQHTTIDAIGIIQDAYDDGWMPTINPQHLLEVEQNEKGAIVQVANSSVSAANLTGYFIYKNDSRVVSTGDNADIYTVGGRLNGLVSDHWKYWTEGAYQFGRKADSTVKYPEDTAGSSNYRGLNAYGFNSKLTYLFKDQLNNQLTGSFELLSGDNPNTGTDEMFDVLWGRWPRWSEIGLYSYAAETRIGQEANLIRFGPTWTVNPTRKMEFSASYYALFAMNDVPTREASSTLFSNNDNFRGHFASAILKYKFSSHMNGHLWSEFLFPGGYYAHDNLITFLRAEVMFTF